MKLPEEGYLLRIFISENDSHHGHPLYEAIVTKAREMNFAGATVVRGIMGFGAGSKIHTAKILRLFDDLPMIVEIVDSKEKIDKLIPWLDEVVTGGLITIEKMQVIKYRHNDK